MQASAQAADPQLVSWQRVPDRLRDPYGRPGCSWIEHEDDLAKLIYVQVRTSYSVPYSPSTLHFLTHQSILFSVFSSYVSTRPAPFSTVAMHLPSLLLGLPNATSLITLSLPPSRPSLAQPLDPHLAAFSLELESWPSWAGELNKPNTYIQQLLSNLEELTGVPPAIRVGGSSLDNAWLNDGVQYVESTFPPPRNHTPYPGASYVEIGRDFYALSGNFAPGTKLYVSCLLYLSFTGERLRDWR